MCDSRQCSTILKINGVSCSTMRQAIQCSEMQIIQSRVCSMTVKDKARRQIEQAQRYLDTNCARGRSTGLGHTVSSCNYQQCQDIFNNGGLTCSTVMEASHCAEMNILQNPTCTEDVKLVASQQVQFGQQYVRDQNCLTLGMRDQQYPTGGNLDLPMADLSLCEYQRCLDILKPSSSCSKARQCIACLELDVLTNPACPASVKVAAQDQMQQEQRYINRNCLSATTTSVPQTRLPTCYPQQCVDNIMFRFDENCGSVSETISCSERLIQNPGCSAQVKDEARLKVQLGREYMRDQCEEFLHFL